MKINAKTYPLLRRALTAKQFEAFVEIREIQSFFEELKNIELEDIKKSETWKKILSDNEPEADILQKTETSKEKQPLVVDTILTKYLHLAADGDLSFLVDDPNYETLLDKLPFPSKEKESLKYSISQSFRKYSQSTQKYSDFKNAEIKLAKSAVKTKNGDLKIDSKSLKAYHNFMQSGNEDLKKFDDFTYRHTSTIVGKTFFDVYRDAHAKLAELDPEAVSNQTFSNVTLNTFGANITGCRGLNKNLYKDHLSHQRILGKHTQHNYSAMSEVGDAIYSSLRFTGNKQDLKKVIALVLTGAAILSAPVIPAYQHAKEYQDSNIYTQLENGQQLGISAETLEALQNSRELLTSLQNSEEFPDISQILELRDMLDENLDMIFSDLVTPAFEAANPDYKVTEVETRYDLGSTDPENPDRWIAIEYLDEKGDTQTLRVSSIDGENSISTMLQANLFNKYASVYGTFDSEINLDYHFFDLLSQVKTAENYELRTDAYSQLFAFLDATLSAEEIVAAKEVIYKDGFFTAPEISLDTPEKIEVESTNETNSTTSPTLDDDIER